VKVGIEPKPCVVSEEAECLAEIPDEFADLYTIVPQSTVRELLEIGDDRYIAVLSNLAGCANSGLLSQQVLAYMQTRYADRSDSPITPASIGESSMTNKRRFTPAALR
jgi:hypothetical protein